MLVAVLLAGGLYLAGMRRVRRAGLTTEDLAASLRKRGLDDPREASLVVLEVDGSISCLKYDEIKSDANTHLVRRRFIQKK